jgi:hypothetical protein
VDRSRIGRIQKHRANIGEPRAAAFSRFECQRIGTTIRRERRIIRT